MQEGTSQEWTTYRATYVTLGKSAQQPPRVRARTHRGQPPSIFDFDRAESSTLFFLHLHPAALQRATAPFCHNNLRTALAADVHFPKLVGHTKNFSLNENKIYASTIKPLARNLPGPFKCAQICSRASDLPTKSNHSHVVRFRDVGTPPSSIGSVLVKAGAPLCVPQAALPRSRPSYRRRVRTPIRSLFRAAVPPLEPSGPLDFRR